MNLLPAGPAVASDGRTRRATRAAVVALLAVGLGALIVWGSTLIALVTPATVGVLALVVMVRLMIRWPDDPSATRWILGLTIVAFVCHLAFSILASFTPNPLNALRSDAAGYHRDAMALVDYWTKGLPGPLLAGGKEGFYYLLGGLYWLFGPHRVAGLAVNATLAAALVPLMGDLTYRLFGRPAARYATILALCLPGVFVWTSQLLKEAPVLFLIAVGAWSAVRISERVTPVPLCVLPLAMALLFTFRGPIALVVAGGLVTGIIVASKQLLGGVGTGVSVVALIAVLILTFGLGLSGYSRAVESDLRQANTTRQDLAQTASGIRPDVDISTPTRALSYLPVGLVDFFLGPFPWQIRSSTQLIVYTDVIVWWALLPSLGRGIRAARRHRWRRSLVLLLPAALASIVLALAVGNFGTIVRERAQVVILLVPLVALGLATRAASREGVREPVVISASTG